MGNTTMNENQERRYESNEEAEPNQKEALRELVSRIREDAKTTPHSYLKDSVVPAGGE